MDYIFLAVGFCLFLALLSTVGLSKESLWDRSFSPDVDGILASTASGLLPGASLVSEELEERQNDVEAS